MGEDAAQGFAEFQALLQRWRVDGSSSEEDVIACLKGLLDKGDPLAVRWLNEAKSTSIFTDAFRNPFWANADVYHPVHIASPGQNVPQGMDQSGLWVSKHTKGLP